VKQPPDPPIVGVPAPEIRPPEPILQAHATSYTPAFLPARRPERHLVPPRPERLDSVPLVAIWSQGISYCLSRLTVFHMTMHVQPKSLTIDRP
jgi:hypothetical protein